MLGLIIVLVCLTLLQESGGNLHHHYDKNLIDALALIDSVISPKNCTGLDYVAVTMGINGGFAAQFHYAAAEWMRAFAAINYSMPVIIEGPMNGYSVCPQCDHVNHAWTCFFQPMSTCEDVLIKTGKRIDIPAYDYNDDAKIPPSLKHLGLAFWWGVVQYKMFRFQPFVEEHIMDEAKHMLNGKGFPFGLPMIGMHVRHGDKHVDGFHEHSLDEELRVMKKSFDCQISNDRGDCFSALNLSNHRNLVHVLKAAEKGQTVVLRHSDINQYNSTGDNSHLAVPIRALPKLANGHTHGLDNSTNISVNETMVIPVHVFVASDDASVLRAAAKLGFMEDSEGVSQTTGDVGMLGELLKKANADKNQNIAYNASLEIISDIFFLSQSSSLLGVCGSQVYRMSVALASVSGRLKYATAMDWNQIRRVKQLSNKWHVPFPEEFSSP